MQVDHMRSQVQSPLEVTFFWLNIFCSSLRRSLLQTLPTLCNYEKTRLQQVLATVFFKQSCILAVMLTHFKQGHSSIIVPENFLILTSWNEDLFNCVHIFFSFGKKLQIFLYHGIFGVLNKSLCIAFGRKRCRVVNLKFY